LCDGNLVIVLASYLLTDRQRVFSGAALFAGARARTDYKDEFEFEDD
jgi:hypothetical protein